MPGPEIVFGAGSIRSDGAFGESEKAQAAFKALESYGIKTLDTAQVYGDSETVLGREEAGSRFTIVRCLVFSSICSLLTICRIPKFLGDSGFLWASVRKPRRRMSLFERRRLA